MDFKLTVAGTALAAFGMVHGDAALGAGCGTAGAVTIAEMTWLSASTLAYVTQHILKDG